MLACSSRSAMSSPHVRRRLRDARLVGRLRSRRGRLVALEARLDRIARVAPGEFLDQREREIERRARARAR